MTLAQVLQKIKTQLEWRTSGGKPLAIITMTKEEAQYLHDKVIALIIERDELVHAKEHPQ